MYMFMCMYVMYMSTQTRGFGNECIYTHDKMLLLLATWRPCLLARQYRFFAFRKDQIGFYLDLYSSSYLI
jgi:hypothetical protein